ncbi:histone-lysine N-methyltransferase SETMAR [Trichonephila clavipes]|nr:histone-lysine N-methyltransferase SETMAR [Trichonephila clavipes]
MSEENVHCMLFEFQKGNNAMKGKRNLSDVFGEVVTARTCQRWLVKFCLGGFSLKDEPISGRPSDVIAEMLRSMIRRNPTLTATEVRFKLGIHQTTTFYYIKRFGFETKAFVWALRESSE